MARMKREVLSILRLAAVLAAGLAGIVVTGVLIGAVALSALVIGLVAVPVLLVAWFLLRPKRKTMRRPDPPRSGPVIETDYRDVTDEKR
jgi:hypothetical protein